MPRSNGNVSRLLSLILAGLLASGCSTWRLQEGPPTTVLESAEKPPYVRLVLMDGRMIEVNQAVVLGDSIVGEAPRFRGTGEVLPPKRRVAIPASDVRSVERRRVDPSRVLLVVVVIGGALLLVATAVEVN